MNVLAPPAAPTNLLGLVNGSSLGLSWLSGAGGGPPSGFILDVTGTLSGSLIVTGAFTGTVPVSVRAVSGAVLPGTYTIAVAATNACGTSPATAAQAIVVP